MALTYAKVTSTILSAQAPGAQAAVSAIQNLGANALVEGLWVFTTARTSGALGPFAAAPTDTRPRILVAAYPVASANGTVRKDDPLFVAEHQIDKGNTTYAWADYFACPGGLPQLLAVSVKNHTDQAMYSGLLSAKIEYVKTTS